MSEWSPRVSRAGDHAGGNVEHHGTRVPDWTGSCSSVEQAWELVVEHAVAAVPLRSKCPPRCARHRRDHDNVVLAVGLHAGGFSALPWTG